MEDVAVRILEPDHLEPVRIMNAVVVSDPIHLIVLELHALGAQFRRNDFGIRATAPHDGVGLVGAADPEG